MAEKTKISYCHHTFNPWIGCTKVSPGCLNCYAENETFPRVQRKAGWELWGKGKTRYRTQDWKKPLRWNRLAPLRSERVLVSLCDWLDDEVPIEWLADFLKLIHATPNLNWLLLTKRPENFVARMKQTMFAPPANTRGGDWSDWLCDWIFDEPPSNVFVGVSCEDQQRADERIPQLLRIPAKVHWVSFEPLLERFKFRTVDCVASAFAAVDWYVIGGESGPKYRDCGVDAITSLASYIHECGVPVYVKQAAGPKPGMQGRIPDNIWSLKQFPKS